MCAVIWPSCLVTMLGAWVVCAYVNLLLWHFPVREIMLLQEPLECRVITQVL